MLFLFCFSKLWAQIFREVLSASNSFISGVFFVSGLIPGGGIHLQAWEHAWVDEDQRGQASRWNATKCKLLKNGVGNTTHATWWPPSGRAPRVLRPVLGFSGHSPDTLNFWKRSYVSNQFFSSLKEQRESGSRTARGAPLVKEPDFEKRFAR